MGSAANNRKAAGADAPCVLLDLDDTILDFRKAEHIALKKSLRALGIECTNRTAERYSEINRQYWEKLEEGLCTRDEVLVGRFDALLAELGAGADAARLRDTYEHHLSEGHYFVDGAEVLLETLYGQYRLFLISNGTAAVQEGRLASAGISKYFEKIFVSEKLGANKPEKAYYERCFEEISDFDPDRCIAVGDSLTSDIRGGINAGVKTCWFNLRGNPEREDIVPDYRIDRLSELPALLEKIFAGKRT